MQIVPFPYFCCTRKQKSHFPCSMSKIPTDAFDVIIDDGTIKEPQNDIEEYRYTKKCSDGIDPNGSQIFVLRVTGFLCIIFGLIEIGIGSYLFSEFSNARAGAWWSALLLPIAGEFDAASASTSSRSVTNAATYLIFGF